MNLQPREQALGMSHPGVLILSVHLFVHTCVWPKAKAGGGHSPLPASPSYRWWGCLRLRALAMRVLIRRDE